MVTVGEGSVGVVDAGVEGGGYVKAANGSVCSTCGSVLCSSVYSLVTGVVSSVVSSAMADGTVSSEIGGSMTTGGDISTTAGWTGSVCGAFTAKTLQPQRRRNIGSSHSNCFMDFNSFFTIAWNRNMRRRKSYRCFPL